MSGERANIFSRRLYPELTMMLINGWWQLLDVFTILDSFIHFSFLVHSGGNQSSFLSIFLRTPRTITTSTKVKFFLDLPHFYNSFLFFFSCLFFLLLSDRESMKLSFLQLMRISSYQLSHDTLGEVPYQKICWILSTASLPLLPGPLWLGVVIPRRVLYTGQTNLF